MPFDPLPNLTQEQLNCLALADFIEESELFDMSKWNMPHCGTAGCIAGHAGSLFKLPEYDGISGEVDEEAAGRVLGLSDKKQMVALFSPSGHDGVNSLSRVDKHRAARVLRNFASTGEVDWSV